MIKIKIEGIEYFVPTSYKDIKIKDYESWYDFEPKTYRDRAILVSKVCKIPFEILENVPTEVFYYLCNKIGFIFKKTINDFKGVNKIDIDGTEYMINCIDKISLGEYIDSQSVNDMNDNKLSTLLAIVCRPMNERYNSDNNESRIKIFGELTLDKAFPLFAFFLQLEKRYQKLTATFSELKEMANSYVQVIETFLRNGDGQKSSMNWLERIYSKLMLYRMKKLLKY